MTIARRGRILFMGVVVSVLGCGGGGDTTGGTTTGGSLATATYVLSWDAVQDPAVSGYRVYYGLSPMSSGKTLGSLDTASTSLELKAADYNIPAGATLYAAVSALGQNGLQSPASNQVSIAVE